MLFVVLPLITLEGEDKPGHLPTLPCKDYGNYKIQRFQILV